MIKPRTPVSFDGYIAQVMAYVRKQFRCEVQRVDMMFDAYWKDSLKAATRRKRGKYIRRHVEGSKQVPSNWQEFLRVDENKSELFHLISDRIVNEEFPGLVIVIRDHQQFNKLRGWIERPVQGQPTITLQARVVPSDYAHFGYRFTKPARTCQLRAITDTGCQSTIMNLEQVHKMGYTKTDLIPTKLRMQAIDTNPIEIIGAIIVRLSRLDIQGNSHETTQICYVSNKIKGMYLRVIPYEINQ